MAAAPARDGETGWVSPVPRLSPEHSPCTSGGRGTSSRAESVPSLSLSNEDAGAAAGPNNILRSASADVTNYPAEVSY